jgi:succinate dehydrogenase / fumarate reductase cytochrome b subunit
VSGLLMVVFVLGHLFIMHYQRSPATTGAAFVAGRWKAAPWRAFDWLLLVLALTHGLAGAHAAVRERIQNGRRNRAALDLIFAAGALLLVTVGTATVIVGPRASDAGPGPLAWAAWLPDALIGMLVTLATLTYLALLGAGTVLLVRLLRRDPLGLWSYPGQWAFALNRLAALGVLGFLLVHVADVALVPLAPGLYERTVAGYALPYLVPMEMALIAAVVFHALNGLRLMALEVFDQRATWAHVPSFVVVLIVTALLVAPSVVILVRGHL